ncbi:secretion/DNA translocation related TadE-like protein [Tamaricihabitans halophyticus]|uniref:Secretion/DNA translocation related TadE-like protein n=1 Tax=Tamaricihabitans halophyticus TaxID=1262583 RepID=A0A4R2R4B0_9PSEU|nr:Rv3654c family TadE-like protein [Tamaricihabitans halophyticus]TCP56847.1 secretion/DNA translocation related TadE-like protein [Tamaricihabitans halophyticus]
MSPLSPGPAASPREPTSRDPDAGFAVVWSAVACALVVTLATLVAWLGAAAISRHRAEAAADLAALAAAAHAVSGDERACARARWVTDQMKARLTSCNLQDWDARVMVAVAPPGWLAGFGEANAKAIAGPAER